MFTTISLYRRVWVDLISSHSARNSERSPHSVYSRGQRHTYLHGSWLRLLLFSSQFRLVESPRSTCTTQGSILRDISRNVIPVLEISNVEVKLNGQCKQLRVVFLDRPVTASLLGREWIAEFYLLSVHKIEPEPVQTSLTTLLTEYSDLFDTSALPLIKGFKAHLIKPNFNFKLFKSRPVPYSLRPNVEAELDRLESLGIISKV